MTRGNLDKFRARLQEFAGTQLAPENFRPQLELDGVVEVPQVGPELLQQIGSLAPFGNQDLAMVLKSSSFFAASSSSAAWPETET